MDRVYLLLGSNKGDRLAFLNAARARIGLLALEDISSSFVYESEPWGFDASTWFLNMAIRLDSVLGPLDLIERLLKIETDLGRVRSDEATGYESREIDIDIIFYGTKVLDTPRLILPHPRMHQRRFVLEPLCDIAPGFIHPVFNKSIRELLDECQDKSIVRRF